MAVKIPKKGAVKRTAARLKKLTEKPMGKELEEFTEKYLYEEPAKKSNEDEVAASAQSKTDLEL